MSNEKLFGIFLNNPDEEYHIRQVARMASFSPMTVTKYLERLRKEGLIKKRTDRGHVIYSANTQDVLFKTKKLTHTIEVLHKSKLIAYFEDFYVNPEAIILFGSAAKGEDGQNSDIDIAIITPSQKIPSLEMYEKKLKKPIQLLTYTTKNIKNNKSIANKIINGIVLSGYWDYEV